MDELRMMSETTVFAGVAVVLIAAFVFVARASSVSVSARAGGGHSGRDD